MDSKKEKFLSQSYENNYSDYMTSLSSSDMAVWDWVIITASNEKQAEIYQTQIDKRLNDGKLCIRTKYRVISDPDGKRIGSGGSTLQVILSLFEDGLLDHSKILLIHSGGDSRRIPQYSVCGKLFAPVPRMLNDYEISSVFDELLFSFAGVPARIPSGMVILSGDTELIFNPLQVNLGGFDAAGLSVKAPIAEGTEHGVFVADDKRNVTKFLHKQTDSMLRLSGAVDKNNMVDIDTGAIWLSSKVLHAICSLLMDNSGKVDDSLINKYINPKVRLNFYPDFIFPMAKDSEESEYLAQAPETTFSDDLTECRKKIWDVMSGFSMKLVCLSPALYLHFGTTHEMFNLLIDDNQTKCLNWQKQLVVNKKKDNIKGMVSNAVISDDIDIPFYSYIEDSIIEGPATKIGSRTIISCATVSNTGIPDNTVLHVLKLADGRFVCRIYGIDDNPKESANGRFLTSSISMALDAYSIDQSEIWDVYPASIWNAKLYPACDSNKEAVESALLLYSVINQTASKTDVEKWLKSDRFSLESSFNSSSVHDLLDWKTSVKNKAIAEFFIGRLESGCSMRSEISLKGKILRHPEILSIIQNRASTADFPLNMRLSLALAEIQADKYSYYEDEAYAKVCDEIVRENMRFILDWKKLFIKKDRTEIKLPVRVNFCGSPSDAAPYCLEHGGTMFDGTILLNGNLPIVVTVEKISEKIIRFVSEDLAASSDIANIEEIQTCGNPHDTFALHKAVLIAMGVIPATGKVSLNDVLRQYGGGFCLTTHVDVPKGSGLGTSSIVAAACFKALADFFGIDVSNDAVYSYVFTAEQLMGTGGGWQDQVGGLTPGFKFFTTKPGTYQQIDIEYVNLPKKTIDELQERFVLVFSGQQRLARNVLREEMNQCIRNDEASNKAITRIREICALMKYYLEQGDVTQFARLLDEQFKLVQILDKGASNTCIDYIFDVCEDLIEGKSICGAGGGGFLQIILKKGVSKSDLKKRIECEFAGCGVEVWQSTFI